ncbi:MAG: TIGR01777 family oxidoreductase [Epsilonproteobacteria bacterium]|nr:TIGR01777 family oxidoreductase [Campylobacterota bacterium]
MKIIVCGMSGFVGNALHDFLSAQHHEVISLSIRSNSSVESIVAVLDGCDVIINLAGANILGRWSTTYKKLLRSSRLETTASLTHALTHCVNPPHTLVNASAVGVYDSYHQHDEYSRHFGDDFLSTLVQDWEVAALKASALGTRVCIMRFGVVYGNGGGAMAKMLPAFKLGFGGRMGDGFQMISWIHLEDLVRACLFLIENKELEGIFNLTTPEPICNLEQTKKMGKYLHRPTFMSMPSWVVKFLFGEGSCVMLDSKEVYPKRLQEAGFAFRYPTFDSAMEQIVHDQG